MRIAALSLGLAAALAAVPAAAQDRTLERAADRLSDPVVQEGIAGAVSALAGIVLDTDVGPLAHITGGRIGPHDTLRDVKRREDPGFERRLHRDTRDAVRVAGMAAGDSAAMIGSLAVTADRLRAALAPFAGYLASRDPRDDYDDGF